MPKDWTDFTPRANPPKEKPVETAAIALTDSEITARLDAMTVEELKALVRLCNASLGGAPLATKKERLEAVELRLYSFALTADVDAALRAINQVMNREFGTPAQTVTVTNVDSNAWIERAKALMAKGLATQKLIDMCEQVGIDTSVYNLKLVGQRVIENNANGKTLEE